MRKVVAVLVLLMTVLFSGCEYFDNTPGSFHIKFEWNEADKPDFSSKDYYAWVLLEEWPEGDREKAVLLMQTAATPFSKTGKVSIDLSDIKYGENKVIKVEIRGSEKSADRVLYFGRSELFSFSSSDRDKEVKVALQTTATPGTGDDENRFNLKIIQNGNVVSKINNTEVTVRINVVQGNRVILANSLSILEKYLNDKKSVTEGFADKAVSELKVFEGNYYDLENWELNFGLEIAEDAGGERIVYGKLLNDDGYMSETVQVSVVVDKTAPGIINPAVTPNPAKLGDIVTAVFSFTEPVDAEKLDLNWDGLNFAESESVTENVFTYTFKVDENTEERNYTLEGRAYDEIGNGPVTFTIGALTVDRTLPSISDETVSVTDDKSAIRTGDTVTVTFKVSEELEKEPEVTVDGKKFKRVGDSADPYTFSYTVSDTDIEGIKTVLVSLSDLARNQNVVEMEQPVKFDLSAPEVINPTVTPAGEPGNAGIGTKIEVRFNISEPVTELKFLVNGEDSELFNQTVSGLTYSYSRTVENNESASQYVFSVSAVDAAGNTLEPYTLGTVDIDVGMPSVLAQTLSKTNVKLLEVFTLDLEFSEELKSLTVLVGSKDISSGCVKSATDLKKYNCTNTANADSDEGDGVKQFSVQMTDMSGNSSTVQLKKTGGSPLTIEYDVTPPAVVNPVIAPSKANSDSTVDVRFSFTEDVENVVMAWDGLEFIRDNSESDKKLFIYKHKVVPADEEKSYTIKILEAFDIAGNPISSEIEIGTVEIDNTPPEIFNTVIKVSDDPLRTFVLENEVISISFEVKEDLSDYAVRIGLKKLSVCTNEDITGGKRYTCTYSTPSSVDGEGTKDVTVEVKDPAGNGTSYAVGQLTYDMSDPQLSSAIVIPERVNSSHSEVKVQFSFSEDVQINVDEVYVAAENFGPELILNCNTGSGYTKQYTCTYSFLESDTRVENYDVSVDLMDAAGNKVTGMFIGKIESDREKPYLSVQNISPVAVRQNEQFTVTFTVNEELAAKPVVKIGDKQIDESSCAGSINYTCQHKANEDGDETDGVKSVTVSLRDPAGNTNIVNLSQTVTYDATRPELLNPVIIPEGTANRYNSKIQVRFSFSEKIDYPASFSFTAESSNSLPVPEFVCTPSNENHQSFSCEGSYETSDTSVDTLTFKVAAKDIAGNALTVDESPDIVGTLKVDRENPVASYTSITPENIIKSTASVTVVFDVSEDTAEPPVVNLGELVKTVPDNLDGNRYTYTFDDLSMLSDGDVIVSVSLTDIAGNINSSPYSGNVTADRTVPSVISKTIAPTIANMNTESVTVNFTFNEKVDSFIKNDVTMSPSGILTDYVCSNSSGDEQNYSCVFSMSTVGTYEGLLTFSVEAVDKAGNAMVPNPVELGTLTIDTIAPELTFDSITPLTVNEDTASVTAVFTVDKVPFGNPVVRINSEKTMDVPTDVTNEGKTFTYTFTDLSGITDGNKNIYVELKDDSGNSFEGISAEQILFDRSAPTVVSKNVAPAVVNKDATQITISFTFSEKMTALVNGDVTVSPSGILPAHNCTTADNQSYTCTVDVSTLGTDKDGIYTYSVSGSDQYGNEMSSAATIGTVTVDRSDLEITFGSFDPTVVSGSTSEVEVVFTLSETPLESPIVKLAGTKTKTVPSNVSGLQYTYTFDDLSGITDGEKGITITVKDGSGNSITEDFTGPLFDRSAPTVVSKNVAPAVVNKDTTQITISFTFSEKMTALVNGDVTVSPSGLPAHNCTTADNQSYTCTVDVSTLGTDKDGTYTYSVSGSDQYGNPMSSAETLGSVLVDRTDPVISFTSALPATVNSTTPSVTVTFSVSETPQSNPVVKLGTTKQLDTPSNVSGLQYTYIFNDLSGITDGEKTINITVKDTSLNPTSTDFTGPLFDRTAPEIITGYISPATVTSSNEVFTLNISFNEEVLALSGADIITDPAFMLPFPNCSNPGSDQQTYVCTYNITGLDVDGAYYFYVSASDIALNSIDPDPTYVIKLEIDRTLPTATISPVTIHEQGTGNVKAGNIARAGDVVFVTVTLSEKLSETPKVRLGTELMQLQGASCVQGSCNFARVIQPSEGDGLKNITVEMEDLVGNRKGESFPDMVIIDVTAPQMHSNFVTPEYAKDNQIIEARFSFSEPVKVSSLQTTYAWAFTKDAVQSTDQLFVYTANSSSFASGSAINFEVKVTDPAGNPLNSGNWLSVGTTNIDKVLPAFTTNTCVVTVSSGYTNPAGFKAVKAGQTVTANCNIVINETVKNNPVLKIGGYAATRQGSCPGGYNNCYVYTVAGTEGDGIKTITSEVEDLAGNFSVGDTGQKVVFDFTAPQLVYYNIYRTPDVPGSTEGQTLHVSAHHPISQQNIVVTFQLFADEHIDQSTVSLVSVPAGFTLTLNDVTNNIAEFSRTVTTANLGTYTFNLAWRDKLGNTSGTITLDWNINADNTATSAADIDMDKILFTRIPYGSEETEGLPRYRLNGSAGAVKNSSVASISAYTLSGSFAGQANVQSDGSFSLLNMSSGNVAEIFVNPTKKSGASMMPAGSYNPVDDFVQVQKTRYIATMGYKTAGSDLNNPNDWYVTKTDKYSVEYVGTNTSTEADGGLLSRLDANPLESGTASKWILAGRNEHPGASNRTVMCYDSKRGKIVLFGGMYDFYSNETWEWYDGKWVRALVDDPEGDGEPVEAIFGHMAYDNKRGVCVYFGGLDKNGNVLDKIWEWNGRSWKRVFTTDPEGDGNPKGIYGGGFAYDNHRNVMVLAGGVYGASNWWVYEYDGVSWRKMPTVTGSPGSSGGKMVYDRNRRVMVFAGGGNQDDETLEYAGQKFIQVCGTGTSCTGLTERSDVMMAYDAKRKVTVYFGGVQSGTATNTINEWNGTSWVTKNPTGDKPAAREEGAMVYHEGRQTVILYGGVNGSTKYNDTWEWNGTVWKRLSNADETWAYPFAKTGFAIGYDEARGVAILHGGNSGGSVLSETWEWNGYGWKKLAPSTTVYREDHTLVYDTSSQKLLMFGGTDNGTPALYRNEVYEWSGTNWVLRPVLVGTAPSGRVYHSAAYDSVRNKMVILGGRNSSGTMLRQLYEWDNATQAWVYRGVSSPAARINAGMVYDPVKQRTIVFGGRNYSLSPESYGDTWEYNNATNGWNNVIANPWSWGSYYPGPGCPSGESWCWKNNSATESPMPRWGQMMVYDPQMRKTVVSGGMVFQDWSEGIHFTAGDTWIYDSASTSWQELDVINKNAFADRTNIYMHKGFYDSNKNEVASWGGVRYMEDSQLAYYNTNILRTGASELPSHMFTVSLDAAGLTEQMAWRDISSINLKVYAGATVYSGTNCAAVNGVVLYGWANDRWLILDQSPASRTLVTEMNFSINKPEMISKMLNGESSELYFKIETKGKAGCGNNDEPLLAVDYAEISVDIKEDSIKERYYVSTSSATWAEARADCISRGMDLAVISSQKEADLIESIITTTRYWIGLYEPSVEGEWEWVNGLKAWSGGTDGTGKTWTKWAVDSNNGMYKPNDTANLNCAIFYNYLSRIFWDWTCGSTTRYICEKRDYSYSGASGSKFTNQTACNNMGGDLVSVNSELEEDAIWPHVVQATNYQYIGLTNMSSSDNIYSWNDGDVCWDGNSGTTGTAYGYTNWGTSQPDSTSTDCVAYLYTMDKWYDYSCYYSTWSGICEFD